MNIDRIISNRTIDRAVKSREADEISNAEQIRSNISDEVVSVSPAAGEAERISAMVEQSTSDRLNQVRKAMADGTYSVSGEAIARKLIELRER